MKIAVRAASYMVVSGMLAAGSIGACNGDDSSGLGGGGGGNGDSGTTSPSDAGAVGTDSGGGVSPGLDAGQGADTSIAVDSGSAADGGSSVDSSNGGDASDAGDAGVDAAPDAAPQTFCAGQTGLAFCEDFDNADPLSLDAAAPDYWTSTNGSSTELASSTAQYSSPPSSLLAQLTNGDGNAQVVKMVAPASGVTQAIYEFDMYVAAIPIPNAGGFATDFQFDDVGTNADQFGFRIGVFSNATGFDHADLEHNHPVLGGNDDITSPISLTAGAWNHVKMVVAYSALANDGGDNVSFQLYLNNSTTADVNANYPAPFAKAPFARFHAGEVATWGPANSPTNPWSIYFDNFTLKLQ